MVKRLFFVLLMVAFIFSINPPVLAQEEREAEDIEEFSLEELLNVEITTAGRQPEKISEIPASIVLVTRRDIEKYGYQSLEEVLQNIPGLYLVDDYFYQNFGVRGFWSFDANRNLAILVNDVPRLEYVGSSNFLEHMNIPVEAIDRIEVVRGPMSVIYGSGAFFGAINIFTNKVEEEGEVSQVSASIGSEKTYNLFARASGVTGDFQYAFNAAYYYSEGINEPLDKMADPLVLVAYGVPADRTTEGILDNTRKYFNFSGKFKGFSFDGSYTENAKEVFLALPSVSDGSSVLFGALRMDFGYEFEFSEYAKAVAKFGFFQDKLKFLDYDYLFTGIYATQTNLATGFRAELNMFFTPTPSLNITLGASYNRVYDIDVDVDIPAFGFQNYLMTLSEGEALITQAVFTQINLKISNRFKIVAGARLEQVPEYQIEDTYNRGLSGFTPPGGVPLSEIHNEAIYSQKDPQFIPRVALIFSLNEKNYIKLLYGKAINRPSFFQSRDLLVYPTSTPLEPEEIQTLEFNYIGTLSPRFSLSLSVFHNILDKLIYRSLFPVSGALVSYFANVGNINTTGAELTLQASPSDDFQLELSGTYQDTTDKREGFEDIDVGYAPKFLGYFKASYFFTADISLAVTGNYVGEMESYYDDTLSPPARLGAPVDGYFLLGANLRIRDLFKKGLFLNFRVSNVLNQEFFYPATANSNLYIDKGYLGKGVSFLATMGWRFQPRP
jgi:outer membrane receptor protein involved in Fe transport